MAESETGLKMYTNGQSCYDGRRFGQNLNGFY